MACTRRVPVCSLVCVGRSMCVGGLVVTLHAGTPGGERGGPGVGGNVLLLSQAWEAIQPEFSTNADGVACYKGVPFELDGGVCSSKVKGGVIS